MERAFGVLQAGFAIVCGPAKQWDRETLWEVMTCCAIMHKMMVEDEGEDVAGGLEFENMGVILSNYQIRIRPRLMSLFKCINKFGIEQLMSSSRKI